MQTIFTLPLSALLNRFGERRHALARIPTDCRTTTPGQLLSATSPKKGPQARSPPDTHTQAFVTGASARSRSEPDSTRQAANVCRVVPLCGWSASAYCADPLEHRGGEAELVEQKRAFGGLVTHLKEPCPTTEMGKFD